MKTRLVLSIAPAMLSLAFVGCQTVDEQAPIELQQAEQAIEDAEDANVDDLMPSAYEAAERKFARSAELLEESSDYQSDNETDQAKGTREEAIKMAVEAKTIADNGRLIAEEMGTFNANSGEYVALKTRADRATALQGEVDAMKAQYAQLEGDYEGAVRDNEDLANRPPESEIPADFRVRKPMAFFASGSTSLKAEYRDDIAQLATMLNKNPDLQVKLEGFADPRGSAELNKSLAEKRLQVVADELKTHGVKPAQVQTVTVGETAENTSGADSGALQLDRKVTATVSVIAH
jgi:outer membrane protein OmpA-like peptidoglycan-associated protein